MAATAVAILVNFVLLGFAEQRNEPVGRLRAQLDQPAPPVVSPGQTLTDEGQQESDD